MIPHIVIITATYNHSRLLPKLYNSLKEQTLKNFRWIIVDDGSQDDTKQIVNKFLIEDVINIVYINKPNGGKSSALNMAFDYINQDDMAIIVDDDEKLDKNAIEKIERYYLKYFYTNVGAIHFNRRNQDNQKIIANYYAETDLNMDYRKFKNQGYYADGYNAYFGYALSSIRFPIFKGEKYIGPSVLLMLCGEKYDTIWAKEVIGTTKYMDGGITKQGRKLRVKNPLGGIYYCILLQSKESGFKVRLKYSLLGYAYKYISGKSKKELNSIGIDIDKLQKVMKMPGFFLAQKWKFNYLRIG